MAKWIMNPNSLEVIENCYVEHSIAEAKPGDKYQFARQILP